MKHVIRCVGFICSATGEDEWPGYCSRFTKLSLLELMNGIVKDYLRIIPRNVTWGLALTV